MNKLIIILSCFFIISGCSRYASNGENVYLQSRNGQKVAVPPPLTSSNLSNFYDLPEQTQNATVSIEPPAEATTF